MAYNNYQTIYGFSILDELHNFFPELLYDIELFNDTLLQWFRYRVETLFPRYVREQNMYRLYDSHTRRTHYRAWEQRRLVPTNTSALNPVHPSTPTVVTTTNTLPPPTTPLRRTQAVNPIAPRRVQRQTTQIRVPLTDTLLDVDTAQPIRDIFDLLIGTATGLTTPLIIPTTGNVFQDVPVIPTRSQVEAGSRLVHASTLAPDTTCSICMEQVQETGSWRTLHCGHHYHDSCILRVFEDSVHCPICRADVRNPT